MEADLTEPLVVANESLNSLVTTFMSGLPHDVRSTITDEQNPLEVDLSSTSTLIQGEREYYKKQLTTLRSFEEADSIVSSEGTSDDNNEEEEAQQEKVMKLSNYGNIVLLIFKIYATFSSGTMAITAPTLDSVLDLLADGILWLAHLSMGGINIYKYPVGKLRVQPVVLASLPP